jgi:hypothetical protein
MLRASRELACLRLEEKRVREGKRTGRVTRRRREGVRAKGEGSGRRERAERRWKRVEEEIEYIRGVAARKVKRLSADDKTASRRPAASKGARARGLARTVIEH